MYQCKNCNKIAQNRFHSCEIYTFYVDGLPYAEYGTHPEHAAENLAKRLDKEIIVELDNVEYMVCWQHDQWIADIAFEKSK